MGQIGRWELSEVAGRWKIGLMRRQFILYNGVETALLRVHSDIAFDNGEVSALVLLARSFRGFRLGRS